MRQRLDYRDLHPFLILLDTAEAVLDPARQRRSGGWSWRAPPPQTSTGGPKLWRQSNRQGDLIMRATQAQARRALRRADFVWDERVEDPRKDINVKHAHHGLLGLVAAAFACG